MATATELLGWIDTAIQDILQNGQHVSTEGDTWTKADLNILQRMRKEYRAASTANSGSIFDRVKNIAPYRG